MDTNGTREPLLLSLERLTFFDAFFANIIFLLTGEIKNEDNFFFFWGGGEAGGEGARASKVYYGRRRINKWSDDRFLFATMKRKDDREE